MEILFWLSFGLVFYSYMIYPLLLSLLASDSTRYEIDRSKDFADTDLPTVAVIIAAYNEESEIINRLENLKNIDYPKDKCVIYIGSDGSTDDTNKLIDAYDCDNLKFIQFDNRRGKASVLNDLCQLAKESILVFSDANTMFEKSAIKKLVSNFSQDNVGGVCGDLMLLSNANSSNQDGLYWMYEKYIKSKESQVNGLLGANGAIYAIKRELYIPIEKNTIIDDFIVAMNIVLQNYNIIYEPEAVAKEYVPDNLSQEFKRRVRIGVGNYQAFFRLPQLLNPFYKSMYFFTYVSHKVLRWFTPHFMLIGFVVNLFLLDGSMFYKFTFFSQVLLYLLTLAAVTKGLVDNFPNIVKLLIYFVVMNTAFLVGFIKYLKKNINPAWERTAR